MSEVKTNVNILQLLPSSSSISLASISSFLCLMHTCSPLLLFALLVPFPTSLLMTSYRGLCAARGTAHSSPHQVVGSLLQCGEAAPRCALIVAPAQLPTGGGMFRWPRCTLQRFDAAQTPVEKQQCMQEERLCWMCFRWVSVTNHWLFIKP